MVRQVINGKIVLTADEGKQLVRNGINVRQVTLGVLDDEANWPEIAESLIEDMLVAEGDEVGDA